MTVEYGVSAKSAEGSAKVTMGDTVVVAGVKMEFGQTYPDTPDEGSIMVSAELLPLSSPEYEGYLRRLRQSSFQELLTGESGSQKRLISRSFA